MKYIVKIVSLTSLVIFLVSCGGGKKERIDGVSSAQLDSVSYAVGRSLGEVIKMANLGDLDYKELLKGIRDVVEESDTPYDKESYLTEVERYLQKREAYTAEKNNNQALEFFERNSKKPDVSIASSGFQYSIVEQGNGLTPTDVDTVTLYFEAAFLDGAAISSNFGKKPVSVPMSDMIEGWREGLKLIAEKGRIKLWLPASLAYGEKGFGIILPNSPLFYEIELVSVKHPVPPDEINSEDIEPEAKPIEPERRVLSRDGGAPLRLE